MTSSSEFAVQSYVVGAYYYQLKPIWKDSFFRLTDAVLAECRKRTQHSLILRCKKRRDPHYAGQSGILRGAGAHVGVPPTGRHRHREQRQHGRAARQLADYPGFLRPAPLLLVNMEYIQNITAKSITMESLAEVPLPPRRFTAVRDQYLEYPLRERRSSC